MLWTIQVLVTSFVIIFVLHNLYVFFKDTLTVPKIKDMVKRPQQKYETLFRELRNNGINNGINNGANNGANNSNNVNANDESNAMKNELKRYLMDLNTMQQQPQTQTQSQSQSQTQSQPQPQSDFIEFGSMFN
jgi:hypothetical protein